MKAYIKIVDKLNKLLEWLVVVVLVILSFVVLAQVVTRKCHISVAWLEEMARYSMIWLCFLGAAVACRRGSLIKIDILYELLPQKVSRYFLFCGRPVHRLSCGGPLQLFPVSSLGIQQLCLQHEIH